MQKAAWLKGFFHFRTPACEVATLLRGDFFAARCRRARLHEDGWSQAKIFFTGCSRKRARRRIRDRKRANQCLVIRCIGRHATSGAVAAGVLRHLRCGDSCVAQSAVTRIRHGARSTDPLRAPGERVVTMPCVERACARAAAAVFPGDMSSNVARRRPSGAGGRREFASLRQVEPPERARAVVPNQ